MKYFSFFLLLGIVSNATFAQDPWKDIYREGAWEQRDTWQRADEIIQKLNIKEAAMWLMSAATKGILQ